VQGKTVVMVTHDPSLTSRTDRNIIISDGELIDEAVSRALPLLRHRHMLEITKTASRKTFQPGEMILECGQGVQNLYLIVRGTVNVMKKNGDGGTLLARLQADDFFGEIELLRGGQSIACIRASDESPVETLVVNGEDFLRIVKESPITAEALGKIIEARLKENSEL
jgi:CRP-like cAMP-binding protein